MIIDPPAEAAARPGLIWGFDIGDGAAEPVDAADLLERPDNPRAFRWLHLNLSDQRSRRWISAFPGLPPAARDLLLALDSQQRTIVEDGWTILVLQDIERDFDEGEVRVGVLRIALSAGRIITARLRPVRSADIMHEKIVSGLAPQDAAAALELVLGAMHEAARRVVAGIDQTVAEIEDKLIDNGRAPDARTFLTLRSLMARLHRLFSGTRILLQQTQDEAALPADLAGLVERAGGRLAALDSELLAVQGQLRLLREEIDLQAAQRTNQNLYILSIMTALMMPATLVTGFFGMNTGGLPWLSQSTGTFWAALTAVVVSAVVYVGLRMAGFIRR